MARVHSYEAVVLKSVNVGEADRFCVFFTRQRGRMAARARGVRKPMSRMGGSLLPFSRVRIDVAETDNSSTVTSATAMGNEVLEYGEYDVFTRLQRGADMVLQLTEDDEPLPRVFDLLVTFVHAVTIPGCDPLVPFSLCLLHILGLLPANEEDPRFARLSPEAKAFILRCSKEQELETLCASVPDASAVQRFADQILGEHLKRPQQPDRAWERVL